ncbi:MAG: PAS domain S-box protein [Anaerolineae bacterium]
MSKQEKVSRYQPQDNLPEADHLTEASGVPSIADEEHDLLRTLIDHLPDLIYIKDRDGRFVACNLANAQIKGYASPQELVGKSTFDTDPPELAERYCAHDLQVMQSGQSLLNHEEPIVDAEGTTRWYSTTKVPWRDAQGNVVGIIGISRDITEWKRVEAALRESEQHFRLLVENLADAAWIRTRQPDGSLPVTYVNPAYERIFGISAHEACWSDNAWSGLIHPEDRPRVLEALHAFLEGRSPLYDAEYRIRRRDGSERWVWARAIPLYDARGRLMRAVGVTQDITERKQAIEALATERNLLRTLIDHMPDAVFIKDTEGRYLLNNLAFARLHGLASPDEAVGKSTFDLNPHELAERYRADDLRVMQSGQPLFDREEPVVYADGSVHWHATTKVPWHDAQGNVIGIIGIGRDITLWKETLAAREEQLRFERLLADIFARFVAPLQHNFEQQICQTLGLVGDHMQVDSIMLLEFSSNPQSRMVYRWMAPDVPPPPFDPSPERYPYTFERLQRGEVMRFSHPDQLPDEAAIDRESFYIVGDRSFLVVPIRAGEKLLGSISLSCSRSERTWSDELVQRITLLGQVFLTALARWRADRALHESERRFRLMVDLTYDWELWIAPDGSIVYTSPSCQRITGYTPAEIVQNPNLVEDIIHPEDRERIAPHLERAPVPGDIQMIELRIIRRDGEVRWLGHVCQPIYAEDGSWLGWRVSNRDITERKRAQAAQEELQAQLLQAQKMEAIGRLTAGIAHDFNNMLTIMNGFAELLKASLPEDQPARAHADRILSAGRRAAELVGKLTAFSRRQVMQLRVLNLNDILANSEAMLRRALGEDVVIEILAAPDLWPIKADASQMEQVILNLVVNARDAMPNGGWLTIETSNVTFSEARLVRGESMPAGEYVRLLVRDTGCGMSQEVMSHLFEPFYTTKPLGQGTGLGLATVYGIVRQSEGYIEVESTPGCGTTFLIYLPRTHEAVPATTTRFGTGPLTPRGTETILVVEDEPAVRQLVVHALHHQGYHVLEASDAQEALGLAETHVGEIHVLLTDVVMPGINGRELATRVIALRPNVKVIMMSGYSGDIISGEDHITRRGAWLQKPISIFELVRTVRQVLDENGPHMQAGG